MPEKPAKSRPPSPPAVRIRVRTWIERAPAPRAAPKPALTEAGADLLEQIAVWGSLSEAARRLHFSYRRAWLLADAMNKAWDQPLITLVTGGKRGGGATLTPKGRLVLDAFRHLQTELEHFLGDAHATFSRAISAP